MMLRKLGCLLGLVILTAYGLAVVAGLVAAAHYVIG